MCVRCLEGKPGALLKARLRALLEDGPDDFSVAGVTCMAGCGHPLTVAFTAPGKASYLFGDINAECDAADLIAFARLYRSLPDGWCNEGQRPPGLAGKTLARIPADPPRRTGR